MLMNIFKRIFITKLLFFKMEGQKVKEIKNTFLTILRNVSTKIKAVLSIDVH